MSDTGEQGVKPQDPADKAGVGGGVVPDDQSEGYAQVLENAEHPKSDSPKSSPQKSGPQKSDPGD